jgi:hypothetical protein
MKITKSQLRKIIKEELEKALNENWIQQYTGGDKKAGAFSPAQVMAVKKSGQDVSDLYQLLRNAKADSSAAALLDLPEFQSDQRVTSLGY